MNYNNAVIPARAMPAFVAPSHADAARVLKATGALFLRCSTGRLQHEGQWWHIVCRDYSLDRLSSKSRGRVRRAAKSLEVRRVRAAWIAEFGHRSHVEFAAHKNMRAQSAAEFAEYFVGLDSHPIFECWACMKGDEILGHAVCLREDDGVFIEIFQVTPAGRHTFAGYLMLHTLLQHYVQETKLPFSNGTRSILHPTEMQDFLLKFGFNREYANLLLVYRPAIGMLVRALYPFRRILEAFSGLSVVRKVWAVLRLDEIVRSQRGAAR